MTSIWWSGRGRQQADLALLVQPPGPADVAEERLAVLAELDLLAEPEGLDGRVPADPGALPPPEQELQRRQVRMNRHGGSVCSVVFRQRRRPGTPARPRRRTRP